jgi:hypothetical protein
MVYVKEGPDQVHAEVKQTKPKLKDVAPRPWIEIIDACNLPTTNASICRLIIDAQNGVQ